MSSITEVMSSDGMERISYLINSPEAEPLKAAVDAAFGPQNWKYFVCISDESESPVGGARVITAQYHIVPTYIANLGIRVARRKYCLESGCVHEKLIDFIGFDSEELPSLPASAEIISVSANHTVAGFKADPDVERYADVYFFANPEECESFFGLSERRGKWQTAYGLTFDVESKGVVRVKTFAYDDENISPNWDGIKTGAIQVIAPPIR